MNENKAWDIIQKDLTSGDVDKVKMGIDNLSKNGKEIYLSKILDLLVANPNSFLEKQITQFLFNLKDQKTSPALINALEEEKYEPLIPLILSIFWQSALDGSEYFHTFIKYAIRGNYHACLESLTVIENLETSFSEEEITEATLDIEEALEEVDEDKRTLLISLHEVVKKLPVAY